MRDILKNSGMRWTRQRQLIYDEISLEKGHYTAKTIRNNLHKKNINIGLSTIYRTLQLLEENNIVKRVPLGLDTAVLRAVMGKVTGTIICTVLNAEKLWKYMWICLMIWRK